MLAFWCCSVQTYTQQSRVGAKLDGFFRTGSCQPIRSYTQQLSLLCARGRKGHKIICFTSNIMRLTHDKSPLKILARHTTNQAIRKASDCENSSFVRSETQTIVLYSGEQRASDFLSETKWKKCQNLLALK